MANAEESVCTMRNTNNIYLTANSNQHITDHGPQSFVGDLGNDLRGRESFMHLFTREHLPQNNAKGIHIRALRILNIIDDLWKPHVTIMIIIMLKVSSISSPLETANTLCQRPES